MSEPAKDDVEAVKDLDMSLRMFIVEQMAHADIDGKVLVANMEILFQWIKNGQKPEAPKNPLVKRALG
jgi:peptidyl-tRNA hydrolase